MNKLLPFGIRGLLHKSEFLAFLKKNLKFWQRWATFLLGPDCLPVDSVGTGARGPPMCTFPFSL